MRNNMSIWPQSLLCLGFYMAIGTSTSSPSPFLIVWLKIIKVIFKPLHLSYVYCMYWHSSNEQFDKRSAIHIALELEALPFEVSQLELVLEDSHNPNFKLYIFKDDLKKKKKKNCISNVGLLNYCVGPFCNVRFGLLPAVLGPSILG